MRYVSKVPPLRKRNRQQTNKRLRRSQTHLPKTRALRSPNPTRKVSRLSGCFGLSQILAAVRANTQLPPLSDGFREICSRHPVHNIMPIIASVPSHPVTELRIVVQSKLLARLLDQSRGSPILHVGARRYLPPFRLCSHPRGANQNRFGGTRFNWSEVGGNALEAGLANVCYPPGERGLRQTGINRGAQIEAAALNNIAEEFWPDIRALCSAANRLLDGFSEGGN